jgi:thiamine-phosphate pyrophosphorylase
MPPRLLAISSGTLVASSSEHGAILGWIEELSTVSGVAVLLREKQLDDRSLWSLACSAREVFAGLLLLSGRPDIALAARTDGVHLPAAGLPVEAVRRRFPSLLIGVSTHSANEVAGAAVQDSDYVTFGPVFPTPSKESFGPPQGLDRLAAACEHGIPVLAIGGIDETSPPAVLARGAFGVAGIRCFATGASAERIVSVMSSATCPPAARDTVR